VTTSYGVGIDSAVGASDQAAVDSLGRFDPDRLFTQFKGNVDLSFYVEPLLNGQQAATLAHEIYGSVRGTSAMGSRVVPIFEQVGGGFYTVRGYDESQFSADNALFATAEYRLHIPRLYSISAQPGELFNSPFRWRPQEAMGITDWDLIFRTFIDAAHITNNDKKVFESDADLIGAGIGLEFQMKRNLFIRADWGFVLRGTTDASGNTTSSSGDNRLHFSATIAY
jgi:outer membrane protein assembly factor BamA